MPRFALRGLVHTGVQIDEDIDAGDNDLGSDEDNDDPFKVFACKSRLAKVARG